MSNVISDILAFKNRDNSKGGQRFTGERIPFLTVPEGKTRLHPISDLPGDEDGKVPDVKFYRYYRLPSPVNLQGQHYESYEVAYDSRDDFEPGYLKYMQKEKKKVNPKNFPWKGFMYVRNLTALKAVDLFVNGETLNAKAFGRDVNELKAAKAYVEQYKKAKEDHDTRREELLNDKEDPKDIGEFVYHGIFIYNFPVTITRNIAQFIEDMNEEGEEPRLTEYVFALTKEGKGKDTSYGFTIDYHVDDVDSDLVQVSVDYVESKELSNFDGLLDRKRFKDADELEEEVKISNMSKKDLEDDDDEEEETSSNW